MKSRLLPSLLNTGLVSLMTVRAANDELTDATTQAPRRSSLPQGNRSIASALWINDPSRFSEIFGSESVPLEGGGPILFQFGDLRRTSDCPDKTSGQPPCVLRWHQDTRGMLPIL